MKYKLGYGYYHSRLKFKQPFIIFLSNEFESVNKTEYTFYFYYAISFHLIWFPYTLQLLKTYLGYTLLI